MREDDGFCFCLLPKDMVLPVSHHLSLPLIFSGITFSSLFGSIIIPEKSNVTLFGYSVFIGIDTQCIHGIFGTKSHLRRVWIRCFVRIINIVITFSVCHIKSRNNTHTNTISGSTASSTTLTVESRVRVT